MFTGLQQGSLRLYGSSTYSFFLYAGRVEIYISGEWGTVYDNGWGNNEANVACKQMGFAGASDSNWAYSSSGSSSQTIWLDDVECTGSETRLINCVHHGLGVENCAHSEDIGVQCTRLTGSEFCFSLSFFYKYHTIQTRLNGGHPFNLDTCQWNQMSLRAGPQHIFDRRDEDTSIIGAVLPRSRASGIEGLHWSQL